jgi:hypothetical protein
LNDFHATSRSKKRDVAEQQSSRVAEWQSSRVAEWPSGRVAEWHYQISGIEFETIIPGHLISIDITLALAEIVVEMSL